MWGISRQIARSNLWIECQENELRIGAIQRSKSSSMPTNIVCFGPFSLKWRIRGLESGRWQAPTAAFSSMNFRTLSFYVPHKEPWPILTSKDPSSLVFLKYMRIVNENTQMLDKLSWGDQSRSAFWNRQIELNDLIDHWNAYFGTDNAALWHSSEWFYPISFSISYKGR